MRSKPFQVLGMLGPDLRRRLQRWPKCCRLMLARTVPVMIRERAQVDAVHTTSVSHSSNLGSHLLLALARSTIVAILEQWPTDFLYYNRPVGPHCVRSRPPTEVVLWESSLSPSGEPVAATESGCQAQTWWSPSLPFPSHISRHLVLTQRHKPAVPKDGRPRSTRQTPAALRARV